MKHVFSHELDPDEKSGKVSLDSLRRFAELKATDAGLDVSLVLRLVDECVNESVKQTDSISFEEFCHVVQCGRDKLPEAMQELYNQYINSLHDATSEQLFDTPSSWESEKHTSRDNVTSVRESFAQSLRLLTAGGAAGACAKTVVAPLDRVKILFQVTNTPFSLRAMFGMVGDIFRQEGVRGLWKGNSATLMRIVPYAGIQFTVFDSMKKCMLREKGKFARLNKTEAVVAGATAGALSAMLTYPLDLSRARLAVQAGRLSILSDMRALISEGGAGSLLRGIIPTILGILPYAGLAFMTNEQLKWRVAAWRGASEPNAVEKLACGAFAGLVSQTATYPLDVVRRRMQTAGVVKGGARSAKGFSMATCWQSVISSQGLRGLFKGVTVNWVKGPITAAVSFTAFDIFKRQLRIQH